MGSVGLKLAEHKTVAVLFMRRKQLGNITLDVGQYTMTSHPCIRCLGVILDTRLSFKHHLEHAPAKAAKVVTALARLMPNIGGHWQPRRELLASVVTSILTYGIAMWVHQDQGMSAEDRSSQPAQRPQGILRFPHGI